MLTSINVSGFKSLENFKLKITKGVNIIVGPNGAGKTNIVSFFEFLSDLMNHNVSEAVFRSGGVSSVFRRDSSEEISAIDFCVVGKSDRNVVNEYGRTISVNVKYEYYATIGLSKESSIIYFKKQSLRIARSNMYGSFKYNKFRKILWDVEIDSEAKDTLRPSVNIGKLDFRKIKPQIYLHRNLEKAEIIRFLEARMLRADTSSRSLVEITESQLPNIQNIRSDLSPGRAYNIHPAAVKRREDISTPVGIKSDGSGTSATLFMLSKDVRNAPSGGIVRRYAPATASRRLRVDLRQFREIIQLVKLVNDSVDDVDVSLDPFDNYIRVNFFISSDNGNINIPLQHMSDGTAKWLALMVAIMTSRNMFALEEPENFLHPFMQKEILKIIRSNSESLRSDNFALITTHSETLLNAAVPTEIIVVSMKAGSTKAERISNPSSLEEVLSETGFGLGDLYVSGGLDNA